MKNPISSVRRSLLILGPALLVIASSAEAGFIDSVKEAGRSIGEATRNVTREIGHTSRDVTREIGHATRDALKGDDSKKDKDAKDAKESDSKDKKE